MIRGILAAWRIWLPILAVLALVWAANRYIDSVYDKGYSAGQVAQAKADQEQIEEAKKKRNERIDLAEENARKVAEQAAEEKKKADAKIKKLNLELAAKQHELDTHMFNSAGKEVCTSTEELHLGNDFSTLWNSYHTRH